MARPSRQTDSAIADTLYVGLDEAGYGPNLGPLVVAATSFQAPANFASSDWWTHFQPRILRVVDAARLKGRQRPFKEEYDRSSRAPRSVAKSAGGECFLVDDSKKVLAASNGLERLYRSVSAFLAWSGCSSIDLRPLHEQLDPDGCECLLQEHWYSVPTESTKFNRAELAAEWRIEMDRHHFAAGPVFFRAIYPNTFNRRLAELGNKAEVELEAVSTLLRRQLNACDSSVRQIVVWSDRLGGRRYYRPLVEEVAGDSFVMTLEEGADRSAYRFHFEGREVEVSFQVEGDGRFLPVALASMIAKYVRERVMAEFNAFWAECIPSLRPTAGYPQDAKRFCKQIESKVSSMGIPFEHLWRNR